jgi:hypothetical protein
VSEAPHINDGIATRKLPIAVATNIQQHPHSLHFHEMQCH